MDFITGKTKKYSDVIFALARRDILSTYGKDKDSLGKALKNTLLDLPGPRTLAPRKMSRAEQFTINLFRPFSEILNSIEAIQNIPIYAGTYPYKKKVSRYSYLRYHIENYLHEIYILDQRYISYLNVIDKAYKRTTLKHKVNIATKELRNVLETAFSGYIAVRGSHVHRARFDDKDIDRLSFIDTLMRSEDKKFTNILELVYKTAFSEIRSKWKKRMLNDLNAINKVNEVYFGTLYKVLTINANLIFPWDIQKRRIT